MPPRSGSPPPVSLIEVTSVSPPVTYLAANAPPTSAAPTTTPTKTKSTPLNREPATPRQPSLRRAPTGGSRTIGAGQTPNQRAARLEPNSSFSAAVASDGGLKVPVFDGPERKSMSTRATRPPPNSM